MQSQKTQKSDRIEIKKKKGKREMKYSKEFKTEALKLSDEIGIKKATAQLGIPYYTLADRRKYRRAGIDIKKIRAER